MHGKRGEKMKKVLNLLVKVLIALVLFFVVTFTVYIFNLDMKLTSAIQPYLNKWYDRRERVRRV